MPEDEIARIQRIYEGYAKDAHVHRRWDPADRGNARIVRERDAAVRALLDGADLWPPAGCRVLDLGCGTGGVLARLIECGAVPGQAVGVDLIDERLLVAARRLQRPLLVRADGSCLPFPRSTFRLVVVFTVFSSIRDDGVAGAVASEMDRVLMPGGSVLWYDFRVRNPWNRNTRRMGRARIVELFPGYRTDLRAVTLVPQLARKLGFVTDLGYPVLASLPFARTHYVGLLTKP